VGDALDQDFHLKRRHRWTTSANGGADQPRTPMEMARIKRLIESGERPHRGGE